MINTVSFPGLGLEFELNRVAVSLFGHNIYWYGVIIATGFLLAVAFGLWKAPRFGLDPDAIVDAIFYVVPSAIIGARLYYVIFYLDLYRDADGSLNWGRMAAVWDGGLAIYGAVITAYIVLHIFCRRRNLSFGAFADLGAMGLLIGQAVGRWGNFMNREAFGSETTAPWRMRLWTSATEYIEVHPTFLYESLWNLAGLLLIIFLISRARTFDGENACFYFIWYGMGRAWIEGMRTDSLYFFGLELFGQPVRVSQVLSLILAAAAFAALITGKRRHPHGQDALYVNRKKALAEPPEETSEETSEEPEEAPHES